MSEFNQLDKMLCKYSYPIFTITENIQHAATAFFFLEDGITYLVSNYHAIKGMSPIHKRHNWTTDTLYLKLEIPNTNNCQILKIDIREEITGKTEIFYMADRIDLFKIKINIENFYPNYINDLIETSIFGQIPIRILIYGFPNPNGIQDQFWSKPFKFESQYSNNGYDNFYQGTLVKMPNFTEKDKMYALDKFYYFINNMIAGGYSGAPIIGEFKNEQNQKVYHFFGVNFGNEPFSNQTWAIKGNVALEYFLNKK